MINACNEGHEGRSWAGGRDEPALIREDAELGPVPGVHSRHVRLGPQHRHDLEAQVLGHRTDSRSNDSVRERYVSSMDGGLTDRSRQPGTEAKARTVASASADRSTT